MSRTVLATSIFVIGLSAYFILSKRVSVKQQVKDCADSVVKRENQNQASDETESISDSKLSLQRPKLERSDEQTVEPENSLQLQETRSLVGCDENVGNESIREDSSDIPIDKDIDKELVEKTSSQLRQRLNVLEELIQTEQIYIRNLELCEAEYMSAMRLQKISNHDIASIFLSWGQMIGLAHTLLTSLERATDWEKQITRQLLALLKNETQGEVSIYDQDECIGDIFLYIAPFFKMYSMYIQNHGNALQCISRLRKRKQFEDLLIQIESKSEVQSLHSYLIMPVQRVPRYELLLKELLKQTPQDFPKRATLERALIIVQESAQHINALVKRCENQSDIAEIERKFVSIGKDINGSLCAPHRILIRRGSLLKVSSNTTRVIYEFFLFNDVLVYAREHRVRMGRLSIQRYHYHRCIPLLSCSAFALDDSNQRPISNSIISEISATDEFEEKFDNSSEGEAENASDSLQTRRMRGSSTIRGSAEPDLGIFISSPVKNLILQAESTNERDLWLFDLNAQINEVKQDRVRRSTVQLNYSPIVEH